MSKDDETTPKPTEEPTVPTGAEAPRQRKIVRRSAATRDNPAFVEPPPGEPAAAAAAEPAAEGAPAAAPAAPSAPSARPRATFDARAPRPRPAPGDAAARSSRGGGDYRPPPARPVGSRPIPGGSRAPAGEGDYRPPPARPLGARPIPGGPRAPAPDGPPPEGPHGWGPPALPRRPRPEGPRTSGPPGDRRDRGPRPERRDRPAPEAGHAGGHDPQNPGAPAAAPPVAARPVAARPVPTPPHKAPPQPPKVATPKAMPVFVPLARAGQFAPASVKPALTPKEALAARTKAHAGKAPAKPVSKAPSSTPAVATAGFDAALVNVGAAEAVAALVSAGEGAAALVDAWLGASNAAAIAEAVESEAAPSAARKAARRAINVLRARGVAVPTRTHVVKMDDAGGETVVEATLSPPDAYGTESFILTSKHPSGRYHLAEFIIREPHGILDAASGWLSGSQLKDSRSRHQERHGAPAATVPVEWARHRIAAARQLNTATGQVVPLGYDRCLELLEPVPEAAPPHPVADLDAAITSEQAAAAAPLSARLHEDPVFRDWLPDRGALDDLLQRTGQRLNEETAKDGEVISAALREEMEAATDRFFSPEARAIVASRMRDSAISVRARKGDRAASEVLAVARAVVEAGLITSPPREIAFLVAFFQKALSWMAQQSGGELRLPVSGMSPRQAEASPA